MDELTIIVAPIILGGGKRLFEGFEQDVELEHIGVRRRRSRRSSTTGWRSRRVPIFHVVRLRSGPDWNLSKPLEEQSGRAEHAELMDALVEDGFIVLGGPPRTSTGSCWSARRDPRKSHATLARDPDRVAPRDRVRRAVDDPARRRRGGGY